MSANLNKCFRSDHKWFICYLCVQQASVSPYPHPLCCCTLCGKLKKIAADQTTLFNVKVNRTASTFAAACRCNRALSLSLSFFPLFVFHSHAATHVGALKRFSVNYAQLHNDICTAHCHAHLQHSTSSTGCGWLTVATFDYPRMPRGDISLSLLQHKLLTMMPQEVES